MDQAAINTELQKRAGLIAQARAILDKAESEKRELTTEENTTFNQLHKDAADIMQKVNRWQQQSRLEEELNRSQLEPLQPASGGVAVDLRDQSRYSETLSRYLTEGRSALAPETIANLQRQIFSRYLQMGEKQLDYNEIRALQADKGSLGGYLVPQQFITDLIKAVDDLVFIRQMATVYPVTSADSLGAPSLDSDPADPTWTKELAIGSEDSTMAIGKRELSPKPLAKYIKISRTLLRKAPNVEGLVRARLAYKQSIAKENAYLNGSGAGCPLGVFTASDDGIPTSRDFSTGNNQTSPTFDGLIKVKYSLKSQYWPKATWIFHRDVLYTIATLKDGNGQYIWRESVRVGEPDRILGFPLRVSEYAPHTLTTGLYVGILGDFSYYWIAESLNSEIQRLDELFATANQIGIVIRSEEDAMPVLAEAFARVKLA